MSLLGVPLPITSQSFGGNRIILEGGTPRGTISAAGTTDGILMRMHYLYSEAPGMEKPILLIAHFVSSSLGFSNFLKLQFIDHKNLICPDKQTDRIQGRLCSKNKTLDGLLHA